MTHLLDTQLLLWAAANSARLSAAARAVIENEANTLMFSAASIWEVAIKAGLGRPDFVVDVGAFRAGLLANGYVELPVAGGHAVLVEHLPPHHRDPFDRMLVAQARHDGLLLVTADAQLAAYEGPVLIV